jgi:hypothetical protein
MASSTAAGYLYPGKDLILLYVGKSVGSSDGQTPIEFMLGMLQQQDVLQDEELLKNVDHDQVSRDYFAKFIVPNDEVLQEVKALEEESLNEDITRTLGELRVEEAAAANSIAVPAAAAPKKDLNSREVSVPSPLPPPIAAAAASERGGRPRPPSRRAGGPAHDSSGQIIYPKRDYSRDDYPFEDGQIIELRNGKAVVIQNGKGKGKGKKKTYTRDDYPFKDGQVIHIPQEKEREYDSDPRMMTKGMDRFGIQEVNFVGGRAVVKKGGGGGEVDVSSVVRRLKDRLDNEYQKMYGSYSSTRSTPQMPKPSSVRVLTSSPKDLDKITAAETTFRLPSHHL